MTEKKQQIIEAAEEIIHEKGYRSTSIADILEAANIGKGQFYYYFKSKHDLGLAVLDDIFFHTEENLLKVFEDFSISPQERILQMLQVCYRIHQEMPVKYGCPVGNLALEMCDLDEEFQQKLAAFFDKWVAKIQSALQEMGQDHAKEKALATVAMMQGGILLTKTHQDMETIRSVFHTITVSLNLPSPFSTQD